MADPTDNAAPPPTPEALAQAKAEKQAKIRAEFKAAVAGALEIVEPATREWWLSFEDKLGNQDKSSH